jgi:predicted CXXCH cytochrome family protein
MQKRSFLLSTLVAVALAACEPRQDAAASGAANAPAELPTSFVGSQACAGCHASEHDAWRSSHHQRAMELATEQTVLGDFGDTSFVYFGRTTRFAKSDARFLVTTENQSGELETFTVTHTLGVEPLQQYLVAFEDGRIQALPFAWDSRPAEAGGQRWFHLYPDEDVKPSSPLFWTRAQQNWNHMCGECHTTNFAKGFSAQTQRFDTRFSELGNGCESCHGAGSKHVAAQRSGRVDAGDAMLALTNQSSQIEQCGVCHARRVRLSEPVAGREKLHETWRPELIQDGLYFADGQFRDEVFEIGSFLQSKMAAHDVRCTSCHEPHRGKLKAEGNALCTQCHAPKYDSEEHHFHASGSDGAQCVSCHMPQRTYMVVHARRDHRIAVPRPDSSDAQGTPNACTQCHADRSNQWAAGAIGSRRGDALPKESFVSAIAKASALVTGGKVEGPIDANDPWLRLGAALGLQRASGQADPARLLELARGAPRAVRLAVAPVLARTDDAALSPAQRQQRAQLRAEYERWLAGDADRADALVSLANVQRAAGQHDAARVSLEGALLRDETSLLALLNLADHARSVRDEAKGEALLRRATGLYPESADAHFVLGLLLARKKALAQAVPHLERATELAPANSYYAYVLKAATGAKP